MIHLPLGASYARRACQPERPTVPNVMVPNVMVPNVIVPNVMVPNVMTPQKEGIMYYACISISDMDIHV